MLIGESARASTAPAKSMKPSKLWETTWATRRLEAEKAAHPAQGQALTERQHSKAASVHGERPGVQQLMRWIEEELDVQGLQGSPPSVGRVRVFSTAFCEVIDMLPSYRPILLSVQKEYDALVNKLQTQINAIGTVEGRFKTLKAESFAFVGESMTWFQLETGSLRQRLAEAETERDSLREERAQLLEDNARLQKELERDRSLTTEMQGQNLDLLRHVERLEGQAERLRAQERDLQGQNGQLKQKSREKDIRIQTMEEQLNTERERAESMVPKEEFEALRAEMNHSEVTIKELEEENAAKQKDYLSLVESYSKNIGQKLGEGHGARPLTPRPDWRPCRGLLDVDSPHSTEKAETAQDLLQHMLTCSRTLLSAYGLVTATNKSALFRRFVRSELALPLVCSEDTPHSARAREGGGGGRAEDAGEPLPGATGEGALPRMPTLSTLGGRTSLKEDAWLPPDTDPSTPEVMRHPHKVRNLRFSRKRTAEFIEGIIQLRSRHGAHGGSNLACPFLDFMLEHLPEDVKPEDASDFVINIYAAVHRYSAEPDFLAYLLLLQGKISDTVVKDNRSLCAELLAMFKSHFESGDGTKTITKGKFFNGMREVLPNKEKDMWLDFVAYFPVGGPDVMVNYEWLLFDDAYILSPIVYALRLQHLEEVFNLSERVERLIRGSLKPGQLTVRYDVLEQIFRNDQELHTMLQAEDYAKAFGIPVRNLKASTEHEVEKVIELMKHGDMFRLLYYPALPSDDDGLAQGEAH